MNKTMTLIFTLSLILSVSCAAMAASEADLKGSKDHPMLSRMPDFYISGYTVADFASHRFNDQVQKHVTVEGRKYYIEYKLKKGAAEPGELKIRRNIQEALKKIGGTIVFDDNFNKTSTIVVNQDGKETWIEVRSYNSMYRLTTVEKKGMEQEVVAKAEVMGKDIHATGHVSIYGIYFDTGKAEIQPASEPSLSEIARLLNNEANLKVYVVGHTDSDGSFDLNMNLSKDRAAAVVKALTGKYGIAAGRLKAYGVASLAPVASNDSEEGKQKNRRVELVKQ